MQFKQELSKPFRGTLNVSKTSFANVLIMA